MFNSLLNQATFNFVMHFSLEFFFKKKPKIRLINHLLSILFKDLKLFKSIKFFQDLIYL